MNPIKYTSVFHGVVLVQVPVARPKFELPQPPAPQPAAAKPGAPTATVPAVDTVA